MGGPAYIVSQFVHSLPLDDRTVAIANGMTLQRMVVDEVVHAAFQLFDDEPMTLEDFLDAVELPVAQPRETLTAMFRSFVEKGFIVPADGDEAGRLRREINARVVSTVPFERFQMPHRMTLEHFDVPTALVGHARHLEVLVLGGCLSQLAEEPLRAIAPSYGLTIGVRSGWLTDVHLLREHAIDLVVLQPGVYRVLSQLWGGRSYFESTEQRRALLDSVAAELATVLRAFDDFGGYVLVQGLSTLQMPPHGRADDRLELGHHHVVTELNAMLRASVAGRPNAMFVDEERLAGNHGKALLFDDMINEGAHHGTLSSALPRLLAHEYLDCWTVMSGHRAIKCVITDLDNTLWSGVVGEGDGPRATEHPFPSIHEALRLLHERGILLATCSKNTHADVMRFWATLDEPRYVRPSDFVTHRINWDAKSGNVAAILDELGVAADAALFLDDNAVERAEVAARFPALRMLGADIAGVKRALLTDPCLQPNVISAEARSRTASTQARIARDAARAAVTDPVEFLRSLEIRMHVARITGDTHVERVIELSRRTNQFNTTLIRYDAATLAALRADPDASVWALAVRDRFASYGLVGMCVVRGDAIENISISCRAIGLHVDQPFLASVIGELGLHARPIVGRIAEGERNHPSRGVFRDAGFIAGDHGTFVRAATPDAPAIDRTIYTVAVTPEAELTRLD